jgi:thiamine kinase-like enzyme
VFDRVAVLGEATDITVKHLEGGLSNISYLVSADGAQYVVRLAGESGRALGLDRAHERDALERAARAGIAPTVVAFLSPEGHCVSRYMASARSFSVEEFRSEETIHRVALRVRDIHSLDPIDGVFDPYDDIRRRLVITDELGVPRPTRLAALLERIGVSQERLTAREVLPVLCHNDLVRPNFLDDDELRVVDWEYAGMGDPMYDLASIASPLDHNGRELLLGAYFEAVDDRLRSDLDACIELYLCWNIVWSLVQVVHSEIDFDYFEFAESRLDRVFGARRPSSP